MLRMKMATAPPMYGEENYHNCALSDETNCKDVLITKVEIHVSCKNLCNRDYLSKSDPMVVLFKEVSDNTAKRWKEIDRTEKIHNDLNPAFVKPFLIEYHFEELQKLKFEIYDSDSTKPELSCHDFLGKIEVHLGRIVGEYGGKVTKTLLDRDNRPTRSTIEFTAEEVNNSREIVELQFQGRRLSKKDVFSYGDPFLIFYRQGIENTEHTAVHKTEVVKNSLNPTWRKFTLPVITLCNGDKHRPIKIECFDFNTSGRHNLIGSFETTLFELLKENTNFTRELINCKKQAKKKNYKNSGYVHLSWCHYRTEPSFLDYITGGIELNFHVAIDFTASNGKPNQPSSLHFRDLLAPNQYVQALTSVGQICEDYDSDKLIPAYGFGARINGNVYHDFPLNQSENPNCFGVAGVIEAYYKYLTHADLYGPTNFSPIINLVSKQAAQQSSCNKYHILLILTDGIISDMTQTKMAIINASKQPLSIIIVGIGDAKFDSMEELDCDKGILSCNGQTAENDIVQFVPYKDFSGSFAADDLAREVLYEVPTQLKAFMKKNGILPRPLYNDIVHSVESKNVCDRYVSYTEHNASFQRQQSAPPIPSYIPDSLTSYFPRTHDSLPLQQRQFPFTPGHTPKEMTAKEAALVFLAKGSSF